MKKMKKMKILLILDPDKNKTKKHNITVTTSLWEGFNFFVQTRENAL